MAVYKRKYTRYSGALTGELWRFAILPRYMLQTVFSNRLNAGAFVLALVPHLIALVLIYLRSHIDALIGLDMREPARELQYLSIDGNFFLTLFAVETFISFAIVAFFGPGLISPDLSNNALPLYLSRPFSRAEYVAGKLSILLILTSIITWVPGVLLFGLQTAMTELSWAADNFRILVAILVGSWIWILTTSLIALAMSAWVKWRTIATAALLGIYFVAAGFGTVTNAILDMPWGALLNIAANMTMVWRWLFLNESTYITTIPRQFAVPAWTGLAAMAVVCGVALALLAWKIRPAEVVR
jgi:ABC-2 type transport system permease protein